MDLFGTKVPSEVLDEFQFSLESEAQEYEEALVEEVRRHEEIEEIRTLDSQSSLNAAAKSKELKFSVALRYTFARGRRALNEQKSVEYVAELINSTLLELLPGLLLECLEKGGEIGLSALGSLRAAAKKKVNVKIKPSFDATNVNAARWARKHAVELADGISETSKERIREALAAQFAGQSLDLEAIRKAVGDNDRADLIAAHETITAVNEGQRQGWAQAVEAEFLTGKEQRVWIGTPGMCSLCEALDGTKAPLTGTYDGGSSGPPLHVTCRCIEGLSL